ncbi:MAG: hypothetical protein C5B54_12080 [Acidobacteria bacterium]|nr:MAG: hypothetical protein C5B54_12080 [Acidobacteriota bacterium]
MIKKVSIFVFVALLAAAISFAATPAPKAKWVMGTVASMDTTAKTITVTVGKESKTYTYDDKSTFTMMHGKTSAAAKVDDLKAGDKVSIDADSANLIKSLKVVSAPKAPSATAPATKAPATTPHQ